MEYPATFSKCPVCGSVDRFGELVTQEEIEKGNLPEDSRTAIMLSRTMVFNPKDNRILLLRKEVPVLIGIFDVCCNCGCLYCISMEKGLGVIQPQVGPRPGGDNLPFFGKG